MKTKYIFLDIDGTVFDPTIRKIPDSTMAALKKAKENGHKLFVCTGRSVSEAVQFKNVGIDFDGFICSSGSVVEIDDKIIYENYISKEDTEKIIKLAEENNLGYALEGADSVFVDDIAYENFIEFLKHELIVNGDEDIHQKLIERRVLKISDVGEIKFNICKISMFSGEKYKFDRVSEKLDNKFRMIQIVTYNEHDHISAEINPRETSKATGIDKILAYLGADIEDTMAYGDSLNDMEMIAHVNTGVAMGNAIAELKAIADDVTTAFNKDGISESFKKYGVI